MEAFNLLKFWRNSGSDSVTNRDTISELDELDYVRNPVIDTDEETDDDDDDDDSFFDLVFTGPDERSKVDNKLKKSGSVNPPSEPESPTDVFFKPKAFPSTDSNTKPQSPISMLRSVPKFRVFFLGFRKSNPKKQSVEDSCKAQSKREEVALAVRPVFTRDNSLRSKLEKEKEEDSSVPKYLKLMKPLYARASKRYTDKIRVFDHVSTSSSPVSSPSKLSWRSPAEEKQGNKVAAFGAVRKHLGKSRSAVSSVAGVSMHRRDDSLMEQNDGIQGAILHCKRSYAKECSVLLSRCTSADLPRASTEELNRWSI